MLVRCFLLVSGGLTATLEPHISNSDSQEMVYLIAGNLNQPQSAFAFLVPEIESNYTYVNFDIQGWNAQATAKSIINDIQEHGYKAKVFAISVGDQVARYLESELGEEIAIYSINPCPFREVLQPKYYSLTTKLALPVEILCHAIGWPTMIPFLEVGGGDYSLIVLIDQYWEIAYAKPPLKTSGTHGVVLSTNDEILDNNYLQRLFGDVEIVWIETAHADTWAAAEEYLEGVKRLLEP